MRIVHINKSDISGGASVAALRLVSALQQMPVEASLLVAEKKTNHPWVHGAIKGRLGKARLFYHFLKEMATYLPHEVSKETRFAWSAGQSGLDLSRHPLIQTADIIHLHWINQGFISIKDLDKLFKLNKPVVWTLHDMWSFTGGCHYAGDCNNYQHFCGFCPFMNDPALNDLSNQQYIKKARVYQNSNLHLVTCSNWLMGRAMEASLFKEVSVQTIPNPIDTGNYCPGSQKEARERLNLPGDKKIILFGAANVSDPRKGMSHLIYALNQMAKEIPREKVDLVVFGKTPDSMPEQMPYPIHLMHYINSPDTLIDLYRAADLFVLPSLEDNLPNTVMEALACGLPVVAFRIGGVPEMVTHGVCGYLATPGNGMGLAKGIQELLFSSSSGELRQNARQKVEKCYTPEKVAGQYLTLYQSLLK